MMVSYVPCMRNIKKRKKVEYLISKAGKALTTDYMDI